MATELAEMNPDEVLLIGVVPESTEQGTKLSDPVREAVPSVIDTVVAELERLGCPPVKRDPPLDLDVWWE